MRNGIQILSTGRSLPDRIVTNDELAGIVDTSDEWIQKRTGMRERRYLKDDGTLLELVTKAAEEAICSSGIQKEEIGIVLVATMSADYFCPSMACLLQKSLLLSEDILALDINAACSGFVYGLIAMQGLLGNAGKSAGLLVGAEALSRKLNMKDRGTCVLFGDGAAAAVIRAEEGSSFASVSGASGDEELIACPVSDGLIRMDGKGTYLFAVEKVPQVMKEAAGKAGIPLDAIDHFVLHQANLRILESVAKKLALPMEKFAVNIEKYGNTSGASVGLALHDLASSGTLKRGETIMLCAFGAGRTWGAVVMKW